MWCTSLVLSAHFSFFFFNDTATTEIYTLSLHDALPILMLEDKEFLASVAELIRENHLTAEKAFEFKALEVRDAWAATDRKSTRLNSSHVRISYAVFCLKKKNTVETTCTLANATTAD